MAAVEYHVDDAIFGFHAQQAVEKALKAWLNVLGHEHPFTHDLSHLLSELDGLGHETGLYEEPYQICATRPRMRWAFLERIASLSASGRCAPRILPSCWA